MFVSSPYSAFFNSGLLARAHPPGSRRQARRSSLPDSTTPRTSSSRKSTSAYYLSLQRRDADEHRSFLSLDVAESRLSERHGPQTASLIPAVPALPPLPVVSPLRSHFSCSRSSSPRPEPSIMLPDPPPPPYSPHRRAPPRLPELPVLPALQFPTYTKGGPRQRPLPDPPSPVSPTSPVSDDPHPRSSVLTKPRHLRSKKPKNLAINTNRLSKASVSTASTRVRRRNRWDALDTLEGRRKPPTRADPPFVPPVPTQKKALKLENVFVKPTTFARPAKPLPRPTNRVVPNFMSLSDDSDPDNSDFYLNRNVPLDINPLLEPEDIVLPPVVRPRLPSAEINTRSYLDVEGDNEEEEEEEEEGVVLEATRCPAPVSPPPPKVVTAPQLNPTQKAWTSRVKGPVGRPLPSIAKINTISTTTTKDKDRTKSTTKPSTSKHYHHSSSRRHKPPTSTATHRPNAHPRNNHSHYKSFIELDMDDLLDKEPDASVPSKPTKTDDREADVGLFEWRGRVGRGIAQGGGDWVWV